ncbi:MAG: hypothetical protein M1820_004571 [Bogoriella megaspora]|nr:MAG: hypothetical protein M1820_004571 [Bogoriella megaspora]
MTGSKSQPAKKSLSRDKPWDRKKYPNEPPPGWTWDWMQERWNDPPADWRFNGRYKYWFQKPICKPYLEGKCESGDRCRKYHPPSPPEMADPVQSAATDDSEPSGPATPSSTEKGSAEEIVTTSSIESILDLEGFGHVSQWIEETQYQTELWKLQGFDLKAKCHKMHAIIPQNDTLDHLKAAEIFHNYLRSSGYFSEEPRFVKTFSSKDHTFYSPESGSFTWPETGTVMIANASELNYNEIQNIIFTIEDYTNLVIVLSISPGQLRGSFDDLKSHFTWQLHSSPDPSPANVARTSSDRVQLALNSILKSIENDFGGRMKLDGASDGTIRTLARRIVKKCDRSGQELEDIVKAELSKIYEKQNERLIRHAQRMKKDPSLSRADELLITPEDILGPPPSVDAFPSDAWNELQSMIGLQAVKSSIRSLLNRSVYNYYREVQGQEPLQSGLSQIFIGPPGTGKTTVAKLYGRVLADLHLLSSGELIVKSAADFIGPYVGHSCSQTLAIMKEARGNVLLIDEAYMLDPKRNSDSTKVCPYRQEATDTLVKEVENKPGEDLCDAFVFEEFDEKQLSGVLDLKLQQLSLSVSKEGREKALELLNLAKQKPNFGNGGAIDIMLSQAISNMCNGFQRLSQEERTTDMPLTAQDFDPDHLRTSRAEEEIIHQFEDMVELESQIDIFRGFSRQAQNARQWNIDPKLVVPFTFVFRGPPGCGKSTVARKIGQAFHLMGLLATNEVVEVSVKDMIAGHIGQTVNKTRKLLENALGKVLFIDEAYRLAGGKMGETFTKETRDELVDAMTKPKFLGKMVIILAGYESDMDKMLGANPGLASRFEINIRFKNLSAEACISLLRKKIEGSSLKVILGKGEDLIGDAFRCLRTTNGWGNGRDIEAIARKVIGQAFDSRAQIEPPVIDGTLVLDVMRKWTRQRYPQLSLLRG